VRSRRWANRTPWHDATREVSGAWLEEEARNSPSPHSLLATWKERGVPPHVMIKLLRRRLAEIHPELMKAALPPIRFQRAQDLLRRIWTLSGGTGATHPVWHLVEAVLQTASEQVKPHQVQPDERTARGPDGAP